MWRLVVVLLPAQLSMVEQFLGKEEAVGSNPTVGTTFAGLSDWLCIGGPRRLCGFDSRSPLHSFLNHKYFYG